MLSLRNLLWSVSLLALLTAWTSAQEVDIKATILKAIEAHGGEDNLNKYKAATVKFKGKLEIMNMKLDITGEQTVLFPDKFRVATAFQINNKDIESVQVFDGKTFWVSVLGKTMELKDEKLISEVKESLLVERAGGLTGLLKKEYELSVVGEVKVKDKDAIGIRAAKKGQRDLNLFFDKKTHLLVKTEYRTRLAMGGDQEVTQEKYFFDHKEVMGMKSPTRILIEHDGKQFMELDITDTRVFETLDASLFAKP